MTQIDEKALEAACNAVRQTGMDVHVVRDEVRVAITAYLSALPPPAKEVGELVKRLRMDEPPSEGDQEDAADALTRLSARLAEAERLAQQRESELAAVFRDDDKMKLLEKYRHDLDAATASAERAEAALQKAERLKNSARAFLRHFNPTNIAEDKAQQWFAVHDAIDFFERAIAAIAAAPASAPGPDVRQVLAQFAVRLGQWKDEHHDCDCPPHHSCGCQELRGIIQEMELYDFTKADALAMLSPASAPGDGWLPIESAPKDGTRVILASFEGVWMGEYIAQYQSGYQVPEGSRWHTALMNHRHIKRQESFSPTHWRPLPASPAKGERT